MAYTIYSVLIVLVFTGSALCESTIPLTTVENKILLNDIKGANTELLKLSPSIIKGSGYKHYQAIDRELKSLAKYFEEVARYQAFTRKPGNETAALNSIKPLLAARDAIPKPSLFSPAVWDKVVTLNNENAAIYDAAKKVVDKQIAERQTAENHRRAMEREEEEKEAQLEAEREAEELKVQKACGKDYGQIRVGMTLAQVQKCVGEFFIHGQASWKGSVVDYYTRGGTYLYIKNGRVVAWGG
ncbi:hypothetical protein [Geobacter sp. SVR]|uniref:hypothetical protein n=1 Tax=Geobacter sp. SVR TaxID=2495594 RepID=UPI0015641D85|nr:hypothetical protein [Geobacter sp. SVR]